MNLAYKYPLIFWNCACLISNSGSDSDADDETETKKKGTDYSKIAKAIGETIQCGTKVSLVDINTSEYEFVPDIQNNQILYGLKAVNSINSDTVDKIISNRPYYNIKDFMVRCPLNKTIMINLIKAGAFDSLFQDFGQELNQNPRILTMAYYLSIISKPKTKLTLSNVNELIQKNLIPVNIYTRIFLLNKYLKLNKWNIYYVFRDPSSFEFYQKNIDEGGEQIELIKGIPCIQQKIWDKIYTSSMDPIRNWLKDNQEDILNQLNSLLFKQAWDKDAAGNLSYWEMQSLCFYYHKHELAEIDNSKYGIVDFAKLPVEPIITKQFKVKTTGMTVPIFKICKIAGTVIGKDDNHHIINLLTTTGVVNVKFTKDYYAMFNRQISELQADGSKKIIEKGWFTRGTKLLISGYRRDNTFVCKKYKSTGGHQLYKILNVQNDELELTYLRYGQGENNEI